MGSSLVSQLRYRCSTESRACAVWLSGTFGPLVEFAAAKGVGEPDGKSFAVLRVHGRVDSSARESLRAWIEHEEPR
jgi:hypothetical protein